MGLVSGAWCSDGIITNSGNVIKGVQIPSKKLFDRSGQLHWSLIGVWWEGFRLFIVDVVHPHHQLDVV